MKQLPCMYHVDFTSDLMTKASTLSAVTWENTWSYCWLEQKSWRNMQLFFIFIYIYGYTSKKKTKEKKSIHIFHAIYN